MKEMNSDLEQRKKDMAECPVWFLNMLKETSEKAKQNEKSYKEMKGKWKKRRVQKRDEKGKEKRGEKKSAFVGGGRGV